MRISEVILRLENDLRVKNRALTERVTLYNIQMTTLFEGKSFGREFTD